MNKGLWHELRRPAAFFVLGVVAVLFLVQVLFFLDAPFDWASAVWSPDGFLGFAGGVVGAIGTVYAVILTIRYTEKSRGDDRRLGVFPCVVAEHVSQDEAKDEVAQLDRKDACIVVDRSGIRYISDFMESQLKKALCDPICYVSPIEGTSIRQPNPTRLFMFVLTNVGLGPAVNASVSLLRGTSLEQVANDICSSGPIVPISIGGSFRAAVLFEDVTDEDSLGDYVLAIKYSDSFGTKYIQGFPFHLKREVTNDVRFSFEYEIQRMPYCKKPS